MQSRIGLAKNFGQVNMTKELVMEKVFYFFSKGVMVIWRESERETDGLGRLILWISWLDVSSGPFVLFLFFVLFSFSFECIIYNIK